MTEKAAPAPSRDPEGGSAQEADSPPTDSSHHNRSAVLRIESLGVVVGTVASIAGLAPNGLASLTPAGLVVILGSVALWILDGVRVPVVRGRWGRLAIALVVVAIVVPLLALTGHSPTTSPTTLSSTSPNQNVGLNTPSTGANSPTGGPTSAGAPSQPKQTSPQTSPSTNGSPPGPSTPPSQPPAPVCDNTVILRAGLGINMANCQAGTYSDLLFSAGGVLVSDNIATRAAGGGGTPKMTSYNGCNGLFINPGHPDAANPVTTAACLKSSQYLAYMEVTGRDSSHANVRIFSWVLT